MTPDFLLIFFSGLIVAAASGLVGSFLILRRMTLLSDALSHVALPGIALGIILKFTPIWGGLIALFFGVILIWLIETKTKLATESVTGVIFVTALAIGALLIPEQDLLEAFFGNVEKITFNQIIFQTIVALIIIFFILKFFKALTLFSIAPELAASLKMSTLKLQLLLLLLVALTITIGVGFVGILLISALSIIPAATARNWGTKFKSFLVLSAVLAMIALGGGLIIAKFTTINAGIAAVLVSAGLFSISLFKRNN